jgi:hypothetical protein
MALVRVGEKATAGADTVATAPCQGGNRTARLPPDGGFVKVAMRRTARHGGALAHVVRQFEI